MWARGPGLKLASTARILAWQVLNQLEQKTAWAEDLLSPELARSGFGDADQRLCREFFSAC